MNEEFNNGNNPFESGSGDWKPSVEPVQNTGNNGFNAGNSQQSQQNTAENNPHVNDYFNGQQVPQQPKKKNGLAIASMVLGIVGVCLTFGCCCCGLPTTGIFMVIIGVVGIVLGAIALKKGKNGMAIAGIVLSAITLLLGLLYAILGIAIASNMEDFQKWLEDYMQNNYPDIWDDYNSEFGNGGGGYGDILINKIFRR